jgi:hypothetical protein
LQKADHAGILLLPLIEFAAEKFAIVLVYGGQLFVGRLDAGEKFGPGVSAQEF